MVSLLGSLSLEARRSLTKRGRNRRVQFIGTDASCHWEGILKESYSSRAKDARKTAAATAAIWALEPVSLKYG